LTAFIHVAMAGFTLKCPTVRHVIVTNYRRLEVTTLRTERSSEFS